jgi:hypothetical protein
MIAEQQHIDHIKNAFQHLKTKDDLVNLLNYVQKMLYPETENLKPILLKSLTYYGNYKLSKNAYAQFVIRKKSGGERIIHAPNEALKHILRCFNLILNVMFTPARQATGFVPEKSVVTNAQFHVGKKYVYNLDLKDFFPSVDLYRVKAVLQIPPFNLNDDLAFILANLCCHEKVLPQGAPTSPTLTNIVCKRLDKKLHRLAKSVNAMYSRYADDMTFSSDLNSFKPNGKFNKELKRIIKEENFTLNEKKTRLQNNDFRQEVTGIIVNERINLTSRYMKQIRAMLHNWEKLGLKGAYQIFIKHYRADKGHVKKGNPDFINVLDGKLQYLKMVRGAEDKLYKKYNEQFESLKQKDELGLPEGITVDQILDVWEAEGIEKAMEFAKFGEEKNEEKKPKTKSTFGSDSLFETASFTAYLCEFKKFVSKKNGMPMWSAVAFENDKGVDIWFMQELLDDEPKPGMYIITFYNYEDKQGKKSEWWSICTVEKLSDGLIFVEKPMSLNNCTLQSEPFSTQGKEITTNLTLEQRLDKLGFTENVLDKDYAIRLQFESPIKGNIDIVFKIEKTQKYKIQGKDWFNIVIINGDENSKEWAESRALFEKIWIILTSEITSKEYIEIKPIFDRFTFTVYKILENENT